jgi:hypothetical protein
MAGEYALIAAIKTAKNVQLLIRECSYKAVIRSLL